MNAQGSPGGHSRTMGEAAGVSDMHREQLGCSSFND